MGAEATFTSEWPNLRLRNPSLYLRHRFLSLRSRQKRKTLVKKTAAKERLKRKKRRTKVKRPIQKKTKRKKMMGMAAVTAKTQRSPKSLRLAPFMTRL